MGFDQLDFGEGLLVASLITLIAWEIWRTFKSSNWVNIYSPTLFVGVVLSYYCIIGPLRSIVSEKSIYLGLDHRAFLVWGWLGALVFYSSLLVGFYCGGGAQQPRRLVPISNIDRLHIVGFRLCLVGIAMFALVGGSRVLALINPFVAYDMLEEGGAGEGGVDVGAVANYFNYAVNLMIPGLCLMWAAWLRNHRHTITLILWLLVAIGIYISLGFRYRLVLVAIPLILQWFMAYRRRPSLLLLAGFLAAFIAFNGFIGLTRVYGSGLNVSNVEGKGTEDFFNAGFSESAVFSTTSGVMEQAPDRSPFIGAKPLMAALLFPIPRALFPSKPDASYIADATSYLYGSETQARGSAFLNYAEYYLIAGWPSLIGLSALLGGLLRRLWNWFIVRNEEPLAQAVYLLTTAFLYVVVSRGYLPQVLMLFFFTILPLFWLYGRFSRPVPRRAPHPAPPLPRG